MAKRKTERGFRIYAEFKDLYGANCRIVESSLVTGCAVWVQNEVVPCGPDKEPIGNAHLDRKMAKRVIRALQSFVDSRDGGNDGSGTSRV